MAFNKIYWDKVSYGNNSAAVIDYSNGSAVQEGTNNIWSYNGYTAGDAQATIAAADYFLSVVSQLQLNDIIFASATDSESAYIVSAITYPDNSGSGATISVASFAMNGSVGTANIQNLAVTTGKIADNAVTSAKIALNTLQYAAVAISAAEFNGMYAAPKLLVAAGGANTLIVVEHLTLAMTFVAAQYAAGGAVVAQYDSTVHGAGVNAGAATIAAATVNGLAASNSLGIDGFIAATPFSTSVNKGLYLSNATAAFTTGDGTWVAHVWYRIIPTV